MSNLEDGPVPTLGWGDRMWVLFNDKVSYGPTQDAYYPLPPVRLQLPRDVHLLQFFYAPLKGELGARHTPGRWPIGG